MSQATFGINVPTKFASSLETFCDNNNIQFQLWNAEDVFFHNSSNSEYLFYTKAEQEKALKWVDRLRQLDK